MPTVSYSHDLKGQSVNIITDFLSCGYTINFVTSTLSGDAYMQLKHRRNGNRISVHATADKVEVMKNGKLVHSVCLPEET